MNDTNVRQYMVVFDSGAAYRSDSGRYEFTHDKATELQVMFVQFHSTLVVSPFQDVADLR